MIHGSPPNADVWSLHHCGGRFRCWTASTRDRVNHTNTKPAARTPKVVPAVHVPATRSVPLVSAMQAIKANARRCARLAVATEVFGVSDVSMPSTIDAESQPRRPVPTERRGARVVGPRTPNRRELHATNATRAARPTCRAARALEAMRTRRERNASDATPHHVRNPPQAGGRHGRYGRNGSLTITRLPLPAGGCRSAPTATAASPSRACP